MVDESVYPIANSPFLLNRDGLLLVGGYPTLALNDSQQRIARQILLGFPDLTAFATHLSTLGTDPGVGVAALRRVLSGLGCRFVTVQDPKRFDIIILDRGWGGVYQTALDLWQALNQHCRVLLMSPAEPPYGYQESLSHSLLTPATIGLPDVPFASFVLFMRSVVRDNRNALVFVSHRALAPYFFDMMAGRTFIIHGDARGEESIDTANHLGQVAPTTATWQIIQELLLGSGEPWISLLHAQCLNWACQAATENWCYTRQQFDLAVMGNSRLNNNSSVVLPFVDTAIMHRPQGAADRRAVLFTTTTDQSLASLKGMEDFLATRSRIPLNVPLRLVVGRAAGLSSDLSGLPNVEIIQALPKADLIKLYWNSIANCRVSSADEVPISVLDSLACETPTIISTLIAEKIPGLRHLENCIVVEPGDLDSLVFYLNELIEQPELQEKLGRAAKKIIEPYTVASNLWRFMQYIDQTLLF